MDTTNTTSTTSNHSISGPEIWCRYGFAYVGLIMLASSLVLAAIFIVCTRPLRHRRRYVTYCLAATVVMWSLLIGMASLTPLVLVCTLQLSVDRG